MKTLVVARWNEDIEWTLHIPKPWKLLIVDKHVHVPNQGREASSYAWALHHLHPTLRRTDTVCCVQGDPFDHDATILESLTTRKPFTWFGVMHESGPNGEPQSDRIPVRELHEQLVGAWPGRVSFGGGAQFIVRGERILTRPRAFYKRLQLLAYEGENPWALERLWGALLG